MNVLCVDGRTGVGIEAQDGEDVRPLAPTPTLCFWIFNSYQTFTKCSSNVPSDSTYVVSLMPSALCLDRGQRRRIHLEENGGHKSNGSH